MSAQNIYDTAPLGALIRYSDNTPQPPARFTKKLAAWKDRNGAGRLTRKTPPHDTLPAMITLHLGNFYGVISMSRVYPVNTGLSFETIEMPRPGMVRILQDYGDTSELLHLAENREEAEKWLTEKRHNNARLEDVI